LLGAKNIFRALKIHSMSVRYPDYLLRHRSLTATVEDYSSVTASPISPAVLKNKKEGAKNVSSFDETHEASTGEDPKLDVSSKLATKETLEDSMLNNVASTSSANRQKGAETNEYFSLSYQSGSTAPPTTSKKTSKKVYGTNSISPTSVEVINETFTSQIPVNIDPIISLSTISSSVDGKNESAPYTTPPILDTLATMKRPQQKGSRDWK